MNLCINDVQFYNDHAGFFLKQSKTDPFRKGVAIKLFKYNTNLCPFEQLKNYLSARNIIFDPKVHTPLLITENGSALNRCNFFTMLREIIKRTNHADSHITGHSFRIGVATSAAKARIEDNLIKSLPILRCDILEHQTLLLNMLNGQWSVSADFNSAWTCKPCYLASSRICTYCIW